MKVKTDEELSALHKATFGVAKLIGEESSNLLIKMFEDLFNRDEGFRQLDYSGAISTILKANNIIFVRLLQFAYHVGKCFPDVETNPMELFEEAIEGLRVITKFGEPNKEEYEGGIKKVRVQ